MKHKINLKSAVAYVFVAIIAMAVMSACDDEDVEDMNPRSHVLISGFVTDEEGNPVENAVISVLQLHPESTGYIIYNNSGEYVEVALCTPEWKSPADIQPPVSDSSGYYIMYASPLFTTLKLTCSPPSDSSLESQEKVIGIEFTLDDPKEKSGYLGSYTGTVDFTLTPASGDSEE